MSHTIRIAAGRVALDGTLELRSGDGYRPVQPTRTPIVATLTPEPETCPCGEPDCDRDEWHELMEGTDVQESAPTAQANKPLFAWTDETLGGPWDSSGTRHWSWGQSEQDWIRTGC
jgi:hypothetical protein